MRSIIICLVIVANIFISRTVLAQMCPMKMGEKGETQGKEGKATIECVGNKMVCPVMGSIFKADKDSKFYEYETKVYYFCCPKCLNKFKASPSKYIEGGEKPESQPHQH